MSTRWYPHNRIVERIQKVARHFSYKKRLEQRCIHEKGILKGTYLVLNAWFSKWIKLNSFILVIVVCVKFIFRNKSSNYMGNAEKTDSRDFYRE
jgi:hypothetical protein